MEINMDEIRKLLLHMGITPNYAGFNQASYAIYMTLHRMDRKIMVAKEIYPDVAKQYGCSWNAVERNIRTVIDVAWKKNPSMICILAGYTLEEKPKAGQFITIVAEYFYGKIL